MSDKHTTIKEEAERILKDREIWGNAWDEYDDTTLIDIVRGKIQRVWNLVSVIEQMIEERGLYGYPPIAKLRDNLIDAYNYGNYLKQRMERGGMTIFRNKLNELTTKISKFQETRIIKLLTKYSYSKQEINIMKEYQIVIPKKGFCEECNKDWLIYPVLIFPDTDMVKMLSFQQEKRKTVISFNERFGLIMLCKDCIKD